MEIEHMPDLTYLSLGWGVQSWTLAAMEAGRDYLGVDLSAQYREMFIERL